MFPLNQVPGSSSTKPGHFSAWCSSNMLGLEPRDRRCKSCRADQTLLSELRLGEPIQTLPWSNTRGIRLLNGTMQVELLPAAPLPGGVKVARRFVKPHGVGASPTLAANLRKAGRYKLAAPVSKIGSASPRSERYRRLPPRPVAQKQSTRLISERTRSVTARDDQPPLTELRLGGPIYIAP